MTKDATAFDAVTTPLDGRMVIEASAGTGKTWSLTRIVLRLVVEKNVPVGRILLVTFTKAATAELAARMKELLAAAYSALEAGNLGELEPFFKAWRQTGLTEEEIFGRLRSAIDNSDDAVVCTIHSFCERMMKDHVFSQGGDFEMTTGDVGAYLRQAVEEFLRREVRDASEAVRTRLLQIDWEKILEKLACLSVRKPPDIRLVTEVTGDSPKKEKDRDPEVEAQVEALLRRFIVEAPVCLKALKREAKIQGFDDILTAMDEALANDDFVNAVRKRFDAVLIDEFQDTDGVQYGIFKTLFMPQEGGPRTLVFVGDPKQSIYRFRSSDISVYEQAVRDVGHTLQLTANWRSTPKLVETVNAFFEDRDEGTRRPFMTESIRYRPVSGCSARTPLQRAGIEVPVFELWKTDESGGECESTGESDELEAQTVAEDIARLLDGNTFIGDRPLRPSDIAILVPARGHADRTIEALRRRGLRVVTLGNREDVFTHDAPCDMLTVLRAVEAPKDRKLLAAAQATPLFGRSLKDIRDGLDERIADSQLLQRLAERFEKGGAAALFAELLAARGAEQRLLATSNGLRYLADCRQMTEVLHDRGRTLTTLAGLIRRIQAERLEPMSDESDRTPRIESDEDLINVQTLHSSKGLEYPVVYLVGAARTHDANKKWVFHVQGSQEAWYVSGQLLSEDKVADCNQAALQEQVRLLYVGMTRASHRLVLPLFFTKGRSAYYRCANAPVFSLWGNPAMKVRTEATKHAAEVLTALKERLDGVAGGLARIVPVDRRKVVSETHVLTTSAAADALAAAPAKSFAPAARISSFSSIIRTKRETPAFAGVENAPAKADDEMPADEGESEAAKPRDIFDPADLRGPDVGTFLHEIMEKADFDRTAGRSELIAQLIEKYSVIFPEQGRAEAKVAWQLYIEEMMQSVFEAPLTETLALKNVSRRDRVSEWPFTMSATGNPNTKALARLLASFGEKYAVGDLDERTLKGYLTGTADLIFQAQGKYWLVDWKSNVVGDGRPADYTACAMDEAMRIHGYRLQYLIYLVALCRYIAARRETTFEKAYELVGGVFYVFLRGAGAGSPTQGIVRERPEAAPLTCLNQFFSIENFS